VSFSLLTALLSEFPSKQTVGSHHQWVSVQPHWGHLTRTSEDANLTSTSFKLPTTTTPSERQLFFASELLLTRTGTFASAYGIVLTLLVQKRVTAASVFKTSLFSCTVKLCYKILSRLCLYNCKPNVFLPNVPTAIHECLATPVANGSDLNNHDVCYPKENCHLRTITRVNIKACKSCRSRTTKPSYWKRWYCVRTKWFARFNKPFLTAYILSLRLFLKKVYRIKLRRFQTHPCLLRWLSIRTTTERRIFHHLPYSGHLWQRKNVQFK
jgi:hypothetical protein